MGAAGRSLRRRPIVLGAIAIAVVVAAVLLVPRSNSSFGQARDLVEQPGNFTTGLEAGDTLAHVSQLLLDEAGECDETDQACQALHTGAAFAQVLAARVLLCTAPGRADARAKMSVVLDTAAAGEVPELPALPVCG